MSRIGNLPIEIPEGVEVTIKDRNIVEVKGNGKELSQKIDPDLTVKVEDGEVTVTRPSDDKRHKSVHGLSRTLIENMIIGVTEGYEKELEIVGTGYRVNKEGNKLVLQLGHSHSIELEDPEGITTEVEGNKMKVKGADKQLVGSHAAKIRSYRSPEPYKGKGVKYIDEHIRRKVGKAGS